MQIVPKNGYHSLKKMKIFWKNICPSQCQAYMFLLPFLINLLYDDGNFPPASEKKIHGYLTFKKAALVTEFLNLGFYKSVFRKVF